MTHGDRVQHRATGKIGNIIMIRPAAIFHTNDGRMIPLPAKYQVQYGQAEKSEWLHESHLKLCEKSRQGS